MLPVDETPLHRCASLYLFSFLFLKSLHPLMLFEYTKTGKKGNISLELA